MNINNVEEFNPVRRLYRSAHLIERSDVAEYLRVTERTVRNWEKARQLPVPVEKLLMLKKGDLSPIGWNGWHISDSMLYTPDGWEFTPGRIMASFYIEQMPDGRKWLDHIGYDWDQAKVV